MNILVAGIPRSGSTRLYNIIRLILLQKFSFESLHCGWHDKFDLQKAGVHNIIKLHYFDQKWCDWADVIFTTKRDLRDVAASSLEFHKHRGRVYGDEVLLNFLHAVIAMHDLWGVYSDYELVYEEYGRFGLRDIMNVSEKLGLFDTNYGHVLDGVEEIKKNSVLERDQYDWVTLMSHYHISENTNLHFSERLSEDQTKLINDNFGHWLLDNGYKI
jgi:hypothetical protein